MKKFRIEVSATVQTTIEVPDHVTKDDIEDFDVDLYVTTPHCDKMDLGADDYGVTVFEELTPKTKDEVLVILYTQLSELTENDNFYDDQRDTSVAREIVEDMVKEILEGK